MIEALRQNGPEIAVVMVAALVLGTLGAVTTEAGPSYERLRFPALRPPNWAFGPAWAIIFAFVATSAVLAWDDAPNAHGRAGVVAAYGLNALLGSAWSPLFFKLERPDLALIVVVAFWASIVALMPFVGSFSPRAAALLAPYLAWVSFASWLNWRIVSLNGPFGLARSR